MQLFEGDCLEVMKSIPGASVDMVLCDLPYGTTQNKWDCPLPLDALWREYRRIAKTAGVFVFTSQTPFDKTLGCSNLPMLKYEWIWEKNVASNFLNANRMPLKIHENILVFYDGTPIYNPQMVEGKPYKNKRNGKDDTGSNYGNINTRTDTVNKGVRFPKTVLRFDREIGLHPTQKPVALMEYLIRTYTEVGSTVLDNCTGSGTTGVACAKLCREFIGIEQDPKYFQIAKSRIDAALPGTDSLEMFV
jgi:site-specific DNA-methyltransferase (adenine-specific)